MAGGRPATRDVAGVVVFLASADVGFVTGETIVVDGGLLARGPAVFGTGSEGALLKTARTAVRRCAPLDVVPFKGTAWPGNGCARPFIVRRRIWSHGSSSRSIRSDDEPLDAHDRTQAGHRTYSPVFSAQGKTTLLKHILANRDGLKVAVLR